MSRDTFLVRSTVDSGYTYTLSHFDGHVIGVLLCALSLLCVGVCVRALSLLCVGVCVCVCGMSQSSRNLIT